MKQPEKPESDLTAMWVCERKKIEAFDSILDGLGVVSLPGTEAAIFADPDISERITYFVLHWPAADGTDTPSYLRYWIKEYYHGVDDWDIEVRDYLVDEYGGIFEAMEATPPDIPVTEEDKFILTL